MCLSVCWLMVSGQPVGWLWMSVGVLVAVPVVLEDVFESGAETAAVPRVGAGRGKVVALGAEVEGPVADQDGPTEYAVNANKLQTISAVIRLRSEVVQSLTCSVSFHLHRHS